jgi:predicted nucleotidyltransferase
LLPDTVVVSAFGVSCRCITLERLIQVKRATGRIKDLEAIAELEGLKEERELLFS